MESLLAVFISALFTCTGLRSRAHLARDYAYVHRAWSDVEHQLETRHTLFGRLLTLLKTYMLITPEHAGQAREVWIDATIALATHDPVKVLRAESALAALISHLLQSVEGTVLQEDAGLQSISIALEQCGVTLEEAGNYYDACVQEHLRVRALFVNSLVVQLLGARSVKYFKRQA